MKLFKYILLLALVISGLCSFAQKKQNLKILYVGGSTDFEFSSIKDSTLIPSYVKERTLAFKNLLETYFEEVDTILGKNYRQEMSKNYDVTVFDGQIPNYRKFCTDSSKDGVKYFNSKSLLESFSYPAVLIAEMGEKIGNGIGSKTDWYCLCLDAHAHSINTKHQIFVGPFKTSLTIKDRPTPKDALHYQYMIDYKLPAKIPMWKVQTKGYMSDNGFRIGMVSRPSGFLDSPETEVISSGECAKSINAVALARDANFFFWGFSASPKYMTDEAKVVFTNAICYISKFKNVPLIARKYNEKIATKDYIKELKYLTTKSAWKERVKFDRGFAKQLLLIKAKAIEKQKSGDKLTEREKSLLEYKPAPEKTYTDFIKRCPLNNLLYKQFGEDESKYQDYYDTNYDYFYGGKGTYQMSIDEDALSLGIPNTDKKILDKSISILENSSSSKEDVAKAKRILDRYTLCDFNTVKEWREWYNKNKSSLFFTQSGGWYYMVNTSDPDEPANNYFAKDISKGIKSISLKEATPDNPVQVGAKLVTLVDGSQQVILKFDLASTFHIYADVSEKDPFIKTKVDIVLPKGYVKVGTFKRPSPRYFNENGTTIYEDETVFSQRIIGAGEGEILIKYKYQCCSPHGCRAPVEKEIKLKTTIKNFR